MTCICFKKHCGQYFHLLLHAELLLMQCKSVAFGWLTHVESTHYYFPLTDQQLFFLTFQLWSISFKSNVYLASEKKKPLTTIFLSVKPLRLWPPHFLVWSRRRCHPAVWCWCGTDITLLVKPTMTLSVVWMGSVGHMVALRPLLLWGHAKWSCAKLSITVYFYADFVCACVCARGISILRW